VAIRALDQARARLVRGRQRPERAGDRDHRPGVDALVAVVSVIVADISLHPLCKINRRVQAVHEAAGSWLI
jgi:hypothetical protein